MSCMHFSDMVFLLYFSFFLMRTKTFIFQIKKKKKKKSPPSFYLFNFFLMRSKTFNFRDLKRQPKQLPKESHYIFTWVLKVCKLKKEKKKKIYVILCIMKLLINFKSHSSNTV